tara:strand:+ start:499 stop:1350 length:852 start_codon:yes stop_codon:yes gene_type:complete
MTTIEIHRYQGAQDGPTLTVFGAIHGNELAGTLGIRELMTKLENGDITIKRGTLVLVPVCNPKAQEQDVRYIDVNLNRLFGNPNLPENAYESDLARQLMPLIEETDYLLDIHSTHISGDPAFITADESVPAAIDFAKALGIPKICVGWEDVYSEEDYTTEAFANNQNSVGLTVECGYHKDNGVIEYARKAITNTLAFLNMADIKAEPAQAHSFYRFENTVRYQAGDQLAKNWTHLDPISKGEAIHYNAENAAVVAEKDGIILIPNDNPNPGDEYYYLGTIEAA